MEFNDIPNKIKNGGRDIYEITSKPIDFDFLISTKPKELTPHETIPPEVIEHAREVGMAGEWKGTVNRSVFEIALPNDLGDIWGSSELMDKSVLRISYFHLKENAKHKGLGTLMLRTFAATAKEDLGYKKLTGQLVSTEVIKTFLTVFGEEKLVFTDDKENIITGEQALKLKQEIGVHGVRVVADLEKLDTTNITKTKIQSSSSH